MEEGHSKRQASATTEGSISTIRWSCSALATVTGPAPDESRSACQRAINSGVIRRRATESRLGAR